jgi:hypothetical protein
MDVPTKVKNAVRTSHNKGLRQHTFVFTPGDMEANGNDTLNAFCEAHNVLSIVFAESKGKLVYVLIYKE